MKSLMNAIACSAALACVVTAGPAAAMQARGEQPAAVAGDAEAEAALVAAWSRYHAALQSSHDALRASEQYRDRPEMRAMAYRALMEAQAMAYNFAIAPQVLNPRVFHNSSWQTELYTLGGNSSDFHYATLFLDGRHTYRLSGDMNDSVLLLAALSSSLPGSSNDQVSRNYDFQDFEIADDGTFEVTLSAQPSGGNWIQLDPDSRFQWILFRPMTAGAEARPASMAVERTSPAALHAQREEDFSPAYMASRIDAAAQFVEFVINFWTVGYFPSVRDNAGGLNQLRNLPQSITEVGGSPSAQYLLGAYAVDEGEALIVEMSGDPGGAFWTVQLFDVWLRSINFRTAQSSLNMEQAARDSDGHFRFVVSHEDPGVANWLDTGGTARGQLLLRNYRTPQLADPPSVTRVRLDELFEHLPADVARVTAEQRAVALEQRQRSYVLRHGE